MRLYAVRVFVHDLQAAQRFYAEVLGLEPLWSFGSAIGFDVGGILIVEHAQPDPDASDELDRDLVGRFVGCSLQVDDIGSVYAALVEKGVEFLGAPKKQPWGGSLAHFRDPSGNVLTLLGDS